MTTSIAPKALRDAFTQLHAAGLRLDLRPLNEHDYQNYDVVGTLWQDGNVLEIRMGDRHVSLGVSPMKARPSRKLGPYALITEISLALTLGAELPRTEPFKAIRYALGDAHLLVLCRAALEDGLISKLPALPAITPSAAIRRHNMKDAAARFTSVIGPTPEILTAGTHRNDYGRHDDPEFLGFDYQRYLRFLEAAILSLDNAGDIAYLHVYLKRRPMSTKHYVLNTGHSVDWLSALHDDPIPSKRPLRRSIEAPASGSPQRPNGYDFVIPLYDLPQDAINLRRGEFNLMFDTSGLRRATKAARKRACAEMDAFLAEFGGVSIGSWIANVTRRWTSQSKGPALD